MLRSQVSGEDDASHQQGCNDNVRERDWDDENCDEEYGDGEFTEEDEEDSDENGDEEDGDEEFTEDEDYTSSGSDEDEDEDEWQSSDDGDGYGSSEYDGCDEEDDYGSYDESGDEEFTEEDEEEYSGSGSGSDEDEDPLLDHAMEVYASDSLSLFRHEYEKCKALFIDCIDESGSDMKYKVRRDQDRSNQCFKVSASIVRETVECCCNHFAVTGMLCSHALAVLKLLLIKRIPDQFLMKWRMKSVSQSLMVDNSMQERRKTLLSLDDCLNRLLKKDKREEGTQLLIRPSFDAENCDGTNHFGSPILRHAKQIYVSKTYELFREEYRKSEYFMSLIDHKFVDGRGIVCDFEVCRPRGIDRQKVHAEAKDGTIKCSCRKFETSGILCAHTLALFNSLCIVKIPHQYLVPRFLKDPSMAADQNIHGPGYEDMLKFAIYMINASGRTIIPFQLRTWRKDDEYEKSLAVMEGELREFSRSHDNQKRSAEEEEMAGKWKLYDDHLIKDFTYKKSEAVKRKLMDYTTSFPTKFF